MLDEKRAVTELGLKVFTGRDGNRYLIFRTLEGSFHTFVEVEAKQAARECGAEEGNNTRKDVGVPVGGATVAPTQAVPLTRPLDSAEASFCRACRADETVSCVAGDTGGSTR